MALTLQQVKSLPEFSDMSDSDIIAHGRSSGFDTSLMEAEAGQNEAGTITKPDGACCPVRNVLR